MKTLRKQQAAGVGDNDRDKRMLHGQPGLADSESADAVNITANRYRPGPQYWMKLKPGRIFWLGAAGGLMWACFSGFREQSPLSNSGGFLVGKVTAETRRRREKYFNHGWTRMDTDKNKGVSANYAN